MKILVLSDKFPPHSVGGYEMRAKEIVDALRLRHEVFVLTTEYGVLVEKPNDLTIHRSLKFVSGESLLSGGWAYIVAQFKRFIVLRRNAKIIEQFYNQFLPDIVLGFQMWDVGPRALMMLQCRGCPIVCSVGDYWLSGYIERLELESNWLKRSISKWIVGVSSVRILLQQTRLIFISSVLEAHYFARGFPKSNGCIVSRGLKLTPEFIANVNSKIASDNIVKSEYRLIYTGRLCSDKGLDIAIKSLVQLRECSLGVRVVLTIVGDDQNDFARELKLLASELGVAQDVVFLGKLSLDDVYQQYKRHDLFVFPVTWIEPLGVSVLEAMANGLPVVATAQGGPATIITHDKTGILVKPGDVQDLANAIERLVRNPSERKSIAMAALNLVQETYRFETCVEKIEKILYEQCSKS